MGQGDDGGDPRRAGSELKAVNLACTSLIGARRCRFFGSITCPGLGSADSATSGCLAVGLAPHLQRATYSAPTVEAALFPTF